MQHISNRLGRSEKIIARARDATRISMPFSEHDIRIFEHKFLTPGMQFLRVPNMQQGRTLVATFLNTLLVYHEVGCVSQNPFLDDKIIHDIFDQLSNIGYISTLNKTLLDEFFTSQFYYDFVWIELDEILSMQQWFDQFMSGLDEFGIYHQIPVLIVLSDK